MNNHQQSPDKVLVIDVSLTRGLAIALIAVLGVLALAGFLAWGYQAAAAEDQALSAVAATGRSFYLTKGTYGGANAIARLACATSYHMASLWELVDPSSLRYNTLLGHTRADSGQGPPSGGGWVRTGGPSQGSGGTGEANCEAWTTASASATGTIIHLPVTWGIGDQDMGPWGVGIGLCSGKTYVWCVANVGPYHIYLPLAKDGHG